MSAVLPVSLFTGSVCSSDNRRMMVWFRKQRETQELSRTVLGQRLCVSPQCIRQLEQCQRRIDVVEFTRYCQALRVSPFEALHVLLQ